ncbi:MAG: exo-alpha-sialidase [Hyphomicrobiales bacterium]|nr:exo-alpha-sialidase [Hyphomicrobiales bacterium]
MDSEFIFDTAPYPQAHAATLAETDQGLAAAWFAGSREGRSDVTIWFSRREDQTWRPPQRVATGVMARGVRYPCWNPVLFQVPNGPLLLFYKVGPSPSRWWGMIKRSHDAGKTWSEPEKLPDSILGPIKNKPVLRDDGVLLCPSSCERAGWRVHMEYTPDFGKTWHRGEPLNDRRSFTAIQPSLIAHANGLMQVVCRTRQGVISECWSEDGGMTWSAMRATNLPNPDSGVDAVTLRDGRALLVYNHTTFARSPLNLALSDDGLHWHAAHVLESQPGEYSYPCVIEGADGQIHIAYTWKRTRIRYCTLRPDQLETEPMDHGVWPDPPES